LELAGAETLILRGSARKAASSGNNGCQYCTFPADNRQKSSAYVRSSCRQMIDNEDGRFRGVGVVEGACPEYASVTFDVFEIDDLRSNGAERV
jgi:hypothetical protein